MKAIASRIFKIQDSYSGKVQIKQTTDTPYWYPQSTNFSRSREYESAMDASPYTIPAYTRIKEDIAHSGGVLEISEFNLKAAIKDACRKASNSFNALKVFQALIASGLIKAEEVPENDTTPIPDNSDNSLKNDSKTYSKSDSKTYSKMQVERPQTQAQTDPIEYRIKNIENRENINPLTPQAIQKRFATIGKGTGFVPPATQPDKKSTTGFEKEFENWYEAYPVHEARAKALPAFIKARGKATLAQLLDSVEAYKATNPEWRKFAMPATWLNQERWNDKPPAEQKNKYNAIQGFSIPVKKIYRDPVAELAHMKTCSYWYDTDKPDAHYLKSEFEFNPKTAQWRHNGNVIRITDFKGVQNV